MGIAQAGIAFRNSASVGDMAGFMGAVFGEPATEIPLPVSARFDIRNHSDVMLQAFGDVCFISNDDLAWPLIRNGGRDPELRAALLARGHDLAWHPQHMRVRYDDWVEERYEPIAWKTAVINGDTDLNYQDWVSQQ